MGSPRCLICGRPAPEGKDTHATLNDCIQALGEQLAEKDKELKVRGDFILNCCNLHCTSDNCPMRPECSIYLKNHPKE